MFKRKASSHANLDAAHAQYLQAEAKVEAAKAQIALRTINAPFAGHIGIRLIDQGQYISPGTPLVSLQSLNPLYVLFNLPEQDLSYLQLNQPVLLRVNANNHKAIHGTITAINAKVDEATRHILVQATIPNPNESLYPGMFANIAVELPTLANQIVVPQTAISYSLSGDYVFILKEEQHVFHAIRQYVTVGERRDNEVVITKGLKAGDRIVTAGQMKLQNGMPVTLEENHA